MKYISCSCVQRAKLNSIVKSIKKKKYSDKFLSKNFDKSFIKDMDKMLEKKIISCPDTECLCEVFTTPNMGRGVRTIQYLEKGTKIGCYIGRLLHKNDKNLNDTWKYNFQYPFTDFTIDGSTKDSIMSLLNHSDKPNCSSFYEIHKIGEIEEIHITFYLNKDVDIGEELFIDYGDEYWEYSAKIGIRKDKKQKLITDYFF